MGHMMILPLTVLDNFFDNPDQIRNYGLSLVAEPDSAGRWPGSKTANLSEINPSLLNHTCARIINLFFDDSNNNNDIIQWKARGNFQLVDSSYQHGWVHHDSSTDLRPMLHLLLVLAYTKSKTAATRPPENPKLL